jgi:mannitol-1-phosphate 5-dehydrogenase
LLWKGGLSFQFIEYNPKVARLLNEKKSYTVRILGEQIQEDIVTGFEAWDYDALEHILTSIATDTQTIFVSVGGKNIGSVAQVLQQALLLRMKSGNRNFLDIVLCENWIKPATILGDVLLSGMDDEFSTFVSNYIGITESVVMRSAIEPTADVLKKDPLAVNVQDFWYLPIDRTRLKGTLPNLPGLSLVDDFNGYLDRKFYTYNAANGSVSYLGYLRGYRFIADAARDPEIFAILEKVYEETGKALCEKHGFDYKKHMEFTRTSLDKLQNVHIVDYVERNARDPIRKLGPTDRLVGPARLVVNYGGRPEALATAIAAALYYDEPTDPIALQLKAIREEKGIPYILTTVCGLSDEETLLRSLVLEKVDLLKQKGWITESK